MLPNKLLEICVHVYFDGISHGKMNYIYICIYVSMYVCMYVCMYVVQRIPKLSKNDIKKKNTQKLEMKRTCQFLLRRSNAHFLETCG